MIELQKEDFGLVKAFAYASNIEREYPISIVEHIQSGRIFVNDINHIQTVLFWHYCGFAYWVGELHLNMLDQTKQLIQRSFEKDQARFILQINDQQVEERLLNCQCIKSSQRLNFEFNQINKSQMNILCHNDFTIKAIDEQIFTKLQGRIIPTFFWDSMKTFLAKGKGYCVIHQGEVVSCAFTAAIGGGREILGLKPKKVIEA